MKNSSDTIGNQIRDLPTCRAVPQPTALPRCIIVLITRHASRISFFNMLLYDLSGYAVFSLIIP